MISGINVQDTLKPAFVVRINTDNLISDSVFEKITIREDTAPPVKLIRKEKVKSADPKFFSDTTFLAFGTKSPMSHFMIQQISSELLTQSIK